MSKLPSKINSPSTAKNVGIVIGMVAGWVASVLLCGAVIYGILGVLALGGLTYLQIVGLLVIWELIKPYSAK